MYKPKSPLAHIDVCVCVCVQTSVPQQYNIILLTGVFFLYPVGINPPGSWRCILLCIYMFNILCIICFRLILAYHAILCS